MSISLWNRVRSEILDMDTSVAVATPTDGASHSRLVILLHGLTGNHMQWVEGAPIQQIADEYRATIVMPDGQRSFWLDQAHRLRWGTWVGEELPSIARRKMAVGGAPAVIAGLSMGGYGAVRAAFDHPRTFSAAISLSGTLDVAEAAFLERHPDLADCGFGAAAPRAEDDLVTRAAGVSPPPIYTWCGTEDRLLDQNRRFVEAAGGANLCLTWEEGPGSHTWSSWRDQLPHFLSLARRDGHL